MPEIIMLISACNARSVKTWDFLQAGFENVNRTLSTAWNQESSFGFGVPGFFNKENVIHLFGFLDLPKLQVKTERELLFVE